MVEPAPPQTSSTYQLERLLRDPDFLKTIDLVTKEIVHARNISNQVARRFVLSITGEPQALACVYALWFAAKDRGESLGRAKVMIRRRVIERLRDDARQPMCGPERQPADALDPGRGRAETERSPEHRAKPEAPDQRSEGPGGETMA